MITLVIQSSISTSCRGDAFVFQCSYTPGRQRRVATWASRSRSVEQATQASPANETSTSSTKERNHHFTERRICITSSFSNEDENNFGKETEIAELLSSLSFNLVAPICPDITNVSCSYTHALAIVPYTFGDIRSYAVAIQSLSNMNDDAKKSKRRRRPVKKNKPSTKPFFVDFFPPSNSRLGKRGQTGGGDLLIKAVSPRSKTVYDLTAGFGQDSLLIAQAGASRVCMVERDAVVAALLSDGLRRLNLIASHGDESDPQTLRARELSKKLTLKEVGDAVELSASTMADSSAQRPDICYVDPMFPSRRKSAAVKKNMQILHGLLGTQTNDDEQHASARQEEEDLLEAALSLARERVVVKRPINSNRLGATFGEQGIKLSYEINGSVNRWDIYVK